MCAASPLKRLRVRAGAGLPARRGRALRVRPSCGGRAEDFGITPHPEGRPAAPWAAEPEVQGRGTPVVWGLRCAGLIPPPRPPPRVARDLTAEGTEASPRWSLGLCEATKETHGQQDTKGGQREEALSKCTICVKTAGSGTCSHLSSSCPGHIFILALWNLTPATSCPASDPSPLLATSMLPGPSAQSSEPGKQPALSVAPGDLALPHTRSLTPEPKPSNICLPPPSQLPHTLSSPMPSPAPPPSPHHGFQIILRAS